MVPTELGENVMADMVMRRIQQHMLARRERAAELAFMGMETFSKPCSRCKAVRCLYNITKSSVLKRGAHVPFCKQFEVDPVIKAAMPLHEAKQDN